MHSPKPIRALVLKEDSLMKLPSEINSQLKKSDSIRSSRSRAAKKEENIQAGFKKKTGNYNHEVQRLLDQVDEEFDNEVPILKVKKQRSTKVAPPANVSIRRHRKKNKKQIEILESHFTMDEEWSLQLVEQLASQLGLEKDQVYKWNWDKRKRLRKKAEKEGKNISIKRKKTKQG
uniref:Homeobox domain-containing protein n=1 Tax=Euplotes harpa TaxID=151035 RepID=A0A7S3N413_9SPIT|mmetsp:Transcript_19080/g.21972  ORF Transcript_19080/g.21972 Transcript_19080/m.21972 type:complete len:175 (+) Transcript_19080:579-1103(+)